MSSAEITGLSPDIVVEMMTSSMPYDVTELDPKGTHSAAPKAMTNTAKTICATRVQEQGVRSVRPVCTACTARRDAWLFHPVRACVRGAHTSHGYDFFSSR